MNLKIVPMNMGEVEVDYSFLVWGTNPGTPTYVPCTSYLILGAGAPIMVDAGFRSVNDLVNAGFPTRQSSAQTLAANLERQGLTPGDIGQLVFTHLHLDHTGLADQLPNARIMVQRKELQYAAAPYFPLVFYDRVDIAKLVGPLWPRIELLDGDATIAPGIRAIVTGGHSPAHQMLYVDLPSGTAIITGDLAYIAEMGVGLQVPSGYVTSIEEAMQGLARIKRDAVHTLPMHDAMVYERYPAGVV